MSSSSRLRVFADRGQGRRADQAAFRRGSGNVPPHSPRRRGVDQKFALERGNLHTVELKPEKPGIVEIECYDHQPSMRDEIVVLPQKSPQKGALRSG